MRQLVRLTGASLCVCLLVSVGCGGDSTTTPFAPSSSLRSTYDVLIVDNSSNAEIFGVTILLDGQEVFRAGCSSEDGCKQLRVTNLANPSNITSGQHTLGIQMTGFGPDGCVTCYYTFVDPTVTIIGRNGGTVQTIVLSSGAAVLQPNEVTTWSFTVQG